MQEDSKCFTRRWEGRTTQLITDISICLPTMPGQHSSKCDMVKGIWDTGAMGCVITKATAQRLGLIPTGMTKIHGVSGLCDCNTYLVNIVLPDCGIQFHYISVTEGDLPGANMLLGMNIITTGDLAITNVDNKTVMSFVIPPHQTIDYKERHKQFLLTKTEIERKKSNKKKKKRK